MLTEVYYLSKVEHVVPGQGSELQSPYKHGSMDEHAKHRPQNSYLCPQCGFSPQTAASWPNFLSELGRRYK